jgi:hypothetical protein
MQIELNERLYRQLEEMARKQGRELDDVLQDAIQAYVTAQPDVEAFRQRVRAAMEKHADLLEKLK